MKEFIFNSNKIQAKSTYDEKEKKTRYFVEGHTTSGDLDLVNDIVTKDCMRDISNQLKGRTLKLDLDHETLRGDNELDKKLNLTKIPLGKAIEEHVDDKGNFVKFELNPNWKKLDSKGDVVMTFESLWDSIKSGYYDAFSIAYVPIKTVSKKTQGTTARLLDRVNMVNIALTGNPINPAATMTAVMAKITGDIL